MPDHTLTSNSQNPKPSADRPRIPAGYGVPNHDQGLVPWSHVEERLNEARVYWVATSGPGGEPRVRPVDGIYLDGLIYIGGSPETRWVRDLEANPRASIHLDGVDDVVIIEGEVEVLATGADADLAGRLAAASNAKFPEYKMKPADYRRPGVRRLRPRRAFAWRAFPRDVTRFTFPGG
jgi:hypothetical protein